MNNRNNSSTTRISKNIDIITVRSAGRDLAKRIGFSSYDQTLITTAISEIARNILEYAKTGEIHIHKIQDGKKEGIKITAEDQGPGIMEVEKVMQEGYSTGNGMGLGLPGAKRIMDDFKILSKIGEGSTIIMKKWLMD